MKRITVGMVEAGVNALANARKLSDHAVVTAVYSAMDATRRSEEHRARNEPPPPYVHQAFPSWRYGPKGESMLCASADDVPDGWGEAPVERRGPGRPKQDAQKAA
jgi:hypothetical protein